MRFETEKLDESILEPGGDGFSVKEINKKGAIFETTE